jgi:alcohol dehydrogenase class IV
LRDTIHLFFPEQFKRHLIKDKTMSFNFYLPTRIRFGWGFSKKITEELLNFGSKRILLVTDKNLSKGSVISNILNSLKEYSVDVYDDVVPEPDIDVAEDIAERTRKGGYDTVIGIGGGSSIDMAKIASVAPTNPGKIASYVGNNLFKNKGIHSVMLPTTSGTGAELTVTSMVTVSGHKQWINSSNLLPELAIIDPELTLSMPPAVTASTGLDALCHNTESFFSSLSSPLTDAVAAKGISLIVENIERAYSNGDDRVARTKMSVGSMLGGIALQARMVYGHSIGYTVATKYRLPHGISCGIPLPYIIHTYSKACANKMKELAQAYDVEYDPDPLKTGTKIAEKVLQILSKMKVPHSFKELGVSRDELRVLAKECLDLYGRPNSILVFDFESMLELYQKIWEGSIENN